MKKIIALVVLLSLMFMVGFIVGNYIGSYQSLNWCVEKGAYFLNISVNKPLITNFLMLYQAKINAYIPNALILNNTGNQGRC